MVGLYIQKGDWDHADLLLSEKTAIFCLIDDEPVELFQLGVLAELYSGQFIEGENCVVQGVPSDWLRDLASCGLVLLQL